MKRTTFAAVVLAALLSAGAQAEARAPEIEKVARLFNEKNFDAAGKALDAIANRKGLSRELFLQVLEWKGIIAAQRNQGQKAADAFTALLTLEPTYDLSPSSPRATDAFGKVHEKSPRPLEFVERAATEVEGMVVQVSVRVKNNDPATLGKRVRFHIRSDGGKWETQLADLDGKNASAATNAKQISWWAELVTEKEDVLANVGTESEPLRAPAAPALPTTDRVTVAPPTPAPTPPPPVQPPPVVVTAPPVRSTPPPAPTRSSSVAQGPKKSAASDNWADADMARNGEGPKKSNEVQATATSGESSWVRTASYGVFGAGLVAAGIGVYFGLTARDLASKLDPANATRDPVTMLITSPTQAAAVQMNDQMQSSATIANILFAAGGGLAATGVVMWIFGGPDSTPASSAVIGVTPNSVSVRVPLP